MKANTLRIGNLINVFNIPTAVTAQTISQLARIEERGTICLDAALIPISETWLIRFGFVTGLHPSITWRKNDWPFHIEVYLNLMEVVFCYEPEKEVMEIKTVDQLQNLYYFTTGKELEVVNEISPVDTKLGF